MSVPSLLNGLRRFGGLSPVNRWFGVEAALALLAARLLTRFVPARCWLRSLDTAPDSGRGWTHGSEGGGAAAPNRPRGGRGTAEPVPSRAAEAGRLRASSPRVAGKVGRVVGKVVRHLPFRARCLPQAMAAQWMLRRRGVRSTLVFGVRRGIEQDRPLDFHAWLMVGEECVVGGGEIESYTAFPPFSVAGGGQ